MKILLESKGPRRLSYDPMEFFAMNKIKNGWTVAIGYLMTPDETNLTFGPRTRKYNIAQNDEKLAEIIEKYEGTEWAEKLKEIRESPKYQAALQSGKSAPFDLGGCTIIKIGRYNFNWRDKEANARDWERRDNMELDIRRKYGFGKDESEYAENDWRRNPKYGGVGVRRVVKSGTQGIARYQGEHDTLYTHIDNNGKMAIRQQLAQRNGDHSKWYFVDEAGVMSELPKEVVDFLRFAYKDVKNKKGEVDINQMEEDERNFMAEIEAFNKKKNSEIKTMVLERILYIVATTVNSQGEHEPVAYVNDKSIYDTYKFLNKAEMMKVIRPWLRLSANETIQMNERFMTNNKSKRLNESLNGYAVVKIASLHPEFINDNDELSIEATKFYNNAKRQLRAAIDDIDVDAIVKKAKVYSDSDEKLDMVVRAVMVQIFGKEDAVVLDIIGREFNDQYFINYIADMFGDMIFESKKMRKSKRLNESRNFADLPQDAMNELSHILFTPRYFAHGEEEIRNTFYPEDPETQDWLLNVGFDMILDEDNPDTVYVISDENPKPISTRHFPNFVKALDEFVTEYGIADAAGGQDDGLVVYTLISNDGTEASIIQDNIDGYTTYYTGFTNFIEIVHMMLNPGDDVNID